MITGYPSPVVPLDLGAGYGELLRARQGSSGSRPTSNFSPNQSSTSSGGGSSSSSSPSSSSSSSHSDLIIGIVVTVVVLAAIISGILLWFGSKRGWCCFNGRAKGIQRYPIPVQSSGKMSGLPLQNVGSQGSNQGQQSPPVFPGFTQGHTSSDPNSPYNGARPNQTNFNIPYNEHYNNPYPSQGPHQYDGNNGYGTHVSPASDLQSAPGHLSGSQEWDWVHPTRHTQSEVLPSDSASNVGLSPPNIYNRPQPPAFPVAPSHINPSRPPIHTINPPTAQSEARYFSYLNTAPSTVNPRAFQYPNRR